MHVRFQIVFQAVCGPSQNEVTGDLQILTRDYRNLTWGFSDFSISELGVLDLRRKLVKYMKSHSF